ncbi:MAG: MoxR family ATPase, partial [Desulfobacterales bacterium]
YIVDIVRRSRRHPSVMVGAGPRASQALLLASRTLAAIRERDFVTPDDIKAMAPTVMGHRLILQPEFEVEGLSIDEVIQEILQALPVPR